MFNHSLQSVTTIEVFDRHGRLIQSSIDGSKPIHSRNWLELTVIDQNGNRQQTQKVPFESYVNNYGYIKAYNLYGTANTTTCKTTANVAASVSVGAPNVLAAITVDTYGIQVGTNTTDSGYNTSIYEFVRAQDYSLRRKISHGTTTGTLSYSATTQDTYGPGNSTLAYTRNFTNSTSSSITVSEVGLIGKANTTEYFLLARDSDFNNGASTTAIKFISTVVGPSQVLEVKYIMTAMPIQDYFTGTSHYLAQGYPYFGDTLTGNFLGITSSDWKGSAETVVLSTGASASVDFSANAAYKLTTAGAGVTTSGILVGFDQNAFAEIPNFQSYCLTGPVTTLDHSAHTVIAPSTIDNTNPYIFNLPTSGVGINDYDIRLGGKKGVIDGIIIGSTRDFTNSTAATITINEAGIYCAGTGTSATVMIQRGTFDNINLAPTQSVRIGKYIISPTRITNA